jgi:hypothetical protein
MNREIKFRAVCKRTGKIVNFGFALYLQDKEGDAEIYQLSDLTFDSCSDIEIIGTIY